MTVDTATPPAAAPAAGGTRAAPRPAVARPAAALSSKDALRRLFGRGALFTMAMAVQMVSALLVVPIVTRLISVDAYGRVAAALVAYSAVSIVAAAGLPEAASRTFFRDDDHGPRDAHRLVVLTAAAAVTVALVADLTGRLWAPAFSLDYGAEVRLAVWGGGALAVLLTTQSLLRAADRVWSFLALASVASLGAQGLGLALTAVYGTPTAYLTGLCAGTATAALLGVVLSGSLGHGLPTRGLARQAVDLGLPLVPHSLAIFLLLAVDRVAIAATLGLGATGRYQVAYAVGGVGVSLVTAVNQAWIPLLLGADPERRWRILASTANAVHRFCAAAAGALALIVPLGLIVAAPPSYDRTELVPVAAIVAFSILPYATASTFFNIMFVGGRTRVMAIAAPLAALFNLGLNFVLLPVVGLVGASVATVAAYGVLAGIVAHASRRFVVIPGVLMSSLTAWALAAPVVLAGALLPPTPAGIAARVVLTLALLAVLGRQVRTLRKLPAAA